ncbi:MAG: hypothetical protein L6R36_001947 [Xanthoria steineri]|nr:MAG: hypothetical protein L6R36_001947 [Xanthoria steineri]
MHFAWQKALTPGCLSLVVSLCLITSTTPTPVPADEPHNNKLSPSTETNALSITQPELSATLPPPGFRISIANGNKPIPALNVFQLTIRVLAALAASPAKRFAATTSKLSPTSQIGLAVGGPDLLFSSNYTIWGLVLASKYMVDHESRNWRFPLYWRNQLVGQIWYLNGNPIVEANSNNSTHDDNDDDGEQIATGLEWSAAPSKELAPLGVAIPSIEFLPSPPGPTPTTTQIMMVIISGLSEIAPYAKDERIRNNRIFTTFAPYRGKLEIDFSWPPLLAPAWYTYGFMAGLLVRLARDYVAQRDVPGPRRLRIVIKQPDGGYVVGQGQLGI